MSAYSAYRGSCETIFQYLLQISISDPGKKSEVERQQIKIMEANGQEIIKTCLFSIQSTLFDQFALKKSPSRCYRNAFGSSNAVCAKV